MAISAIKFAAFFVIAMVLTNSTSHAFFAKNPLDQFQGKSVNELVPGIADIKQEIMKLSPEQGKAIAEKLDGSIQTAVDSVMSSAKNFLSLPFGR